MSTGPNGGRFSDPLQRCERLAKRTIVLALAEALFRVRADCGRFWIGIYVEEFARPYR